MYRLIMTVWGVDIKGKVFATLEDAEKAKAEMQDICVKNGMDTPIRIENAQ